MLQGGMSSSSSSSASSMWLDMQGLHWLLLLLLRRLQLQLLACTVQ
jgi:hypothetical protein